MFGKRCTLCGGKIVHGRCEDCGLDATKSDDQYRINESSCDGKPLTHMHTEQSMSYGTEKKSKPKKTYNAKKIQDTVYQAAQKNAGRYNNGRRINGRGLLVVVVLVVIAVLAEAVGPILRYAENKISQVSVTDEFDDVILNFGNVHSYSDDGTYDYVTYDLSETGDEHSETLSAGYYKVGVDIPEGTYVISAEAGDGSVRIDDRENGIYIYENIAIDSEHDEDPELIEDVRLYQGAYVELTDNLVAALSTDNAQLSKMQERIVNPLTEEVTIDASKKSQSVKAGVDFEAGVYDIAVIDGYGFMKIYVPGYTYINEEENEEYSTTSLFFDSDGEYGAKIYHNVAIPQDTRLEVEETMKFQLTPSTEIESTDYQVIWDVLY